MARSFVSVILALVKCAAPGGILPPDPRAALRMKSCARSTAAAAIPAHTDDQHKWATGVIVCAWILSYGTGNIWFAAPLKFSLNPALQVPRMPSVSHARVGSSV